MSPPFMTKRMRHPSLVKQEENIVEQQKYVSNSITMSQEDGN